VCSPDDGGDAVGATSRSNALHALLRREGSGLVRANYKSETNPENPDAKGTPGVHSGPDASGAKQRAEEMTTGPRYNKVAWNPPAGSERLR
jgi:hypothetical protein